MMAARVPVLDELDPDTVTADQLPVLIKASAWRRPRYAGGARTVRAATQVEAARREAQSAFGDPTVFCERYLATGHHVEVQVLADEHGTVGRRRTRMLDPAATPEDHRGGAVAARRTHLHAGQAVRRGAAGATHRLHRRGVVEFMADDNGDFFFLEMNTRLQVEHPVTEPPPASTSSGCNCMSPTAAASIPNRRRRAATRSRPPVRRRSRQGLAAAGRLGTASLEHHNAIRDAGQARRAGRHRHRRRSRCRCSTTRCWPRSSPTRRPAARPRDCWPTRWPAPASTACAPTETCSSTCCAIRPSSTALRTPRSSTPTAWPNCRAAGRSTRSRVVGVGRRAGGCHREPPGRNGFAAAPSGWRNVMSGFQTKSYADGAGEAHPVRYRFTRIGVELPDFDAVTLVSASPIEWCWRSTAWTARSTWPATATTCSSTPTRPSATRRAAAVPRSGSRRTRFTAGAHAGFGAPHRGRGTPSPRASR